MHQRVHPPLPPLFPLPFTCHTRTRITGQAAIFGYAAVFPPRYTQAMMAGQGLAGLIVAVAGIAAAASSNVRDSMIPGRYNGHTASPHVDSTDHPFPPHRPTPARAWRTRAPPSAWATTGWTTTPSPILAPAL